MQTTAFTSPYSADQSAIERKRKLAEALQAQALQPIEQANVGAGQFATPISPWQGAAKLAQAFVGARNASKAEAQQRELSKKVEAQSGMDMGILAKALQESQGKVIQPDPQEIQQAADQGTAVPIPSQIPAQSVQERLQGALGQMKDQTSRQAAMGILGQYAAAQVPKKPDAYTLKPGEARYGPNGELLNMGAPEKPEGAFALAPGHTRYDANGKAIVTAPDKPAEQIPVTPITVIDENGRAVVKDGRTGKVLGISPQDPKLAGAFNSDTAALTGTNASMDRLANAANQILNHPGLDGITGLRGKIPNLPGSNAADAEALLGTLKSQVGFGVLQDMRNNSKTGGALGSVSDAEGKRLEANLAALDKSQSLGQMKSNLKAIIDYTEQAKDRMRESFNLKHGGQGGLPTRPGATPAAPETPKRRASDAPGKVMNWSDLGR